VHNDRTKTNSNKAEEAAKKFNIMRENLDNEIDEDVQPKDWLHPADTVENN
jgi:hypothetical protein